MSFPPKKRRRIGELARAYADGRRAAMAGDPAPVLPRSATTRERMYVQGYRDEAQRMRAVGRFPQGELALV